MVEFTDGGKGGGRSQSIDGEKAWSSMKSFNTICVSPFTQIYAPTPKRMLLITRGGEQGGGCCPRKRPKSSVSLYVWVSADGSCKQSGIDSDI